MRCPTGPGSSTPLTPNRVMVWPAFILTRPLVAAGGDALTKPAAQGGLGWGTISGTTALSALLAVLAAYQMRTLARHPLPPLPAPVDRRTGQPQRPKGARFVPTAGAQAG